MSDANRYVNAYIDTCVATINDLNIKYIQSQAQLKVASDLVADRERRILELQAELENQKGINENSKKSLDDAKIMEDSYNAMKNKLSHMDTLMNQMGQMKLKISAKDEEIQKLQNQIIEITTGKPKKKKDVKAEEVVETSAETVNDF